MDESVAEVLTEALPLLARAVGATLAAIAGTSVELNGLHRVAADPTFLDVWVVWCGGLLFLASYVLVSDLAVRLRTPTSS